MAPIFQSGAFVQQCFAVHPLCLSVKRVEAGARMIVGCTSCNLSHRLTIGDVAMRMAVVPSESGSPLASPPTASASEQLSACAAQHATALSVRAMDVVEELVGLRCAECRCVFELHVPTIETHQK